MKRKLIQIGITANESYQYRPVQHQGREHWIIPIVMMVEGVHHGSMGPLYYPTDELARFTAAWNGRPVTIGHPADEQGEYVSANSPDGAVNAAGHIYNTHMDGGRLKAEAWVDPQRLTAEARAIIQDGRPLDVSVGVFTDQEETEGEWHGERYQAIARNYRPDHLALLPGGQGACSWDDGCGVRNQESNINDNNKQKGGNMKRKRNGSDTDKTVDLEQVVNRLTDNEAGFREISQNLQSKLDALDNDMRIHYLEEVYDDYLVYRVQNRESGEATLYRRDYQVANDGEISLDDNTVQVRKQVSYVEVNNSENNTTETNDTNSINVKSKKGGSKMTRNKKTPCKIDALINNEATQFTEEDREWLESLEDDQLEKLSPVENEKTDPPPADNKKEKEEDKPAASAEKQDEQKVTAEDIKAVLSNMEAEEFIGLLPKETGRQMRSGLQMYKSQRDKVIKEITDNSSFTAERLDDWSDEDLNDLHKSVVREQHDYSVNANRLHVSAEGISEAGKAMMIKDSDYQPEEKKTK